MAATGPTHYWIPCDPPKDPIPQDPVPREVQARVNGKETSYVQQRFETEEGGEYKTINGRWHRKVTRGGYNKWAKATGHKPAP